MTRAWIFHSIKTIGMVAYVTIDRSYWNVEQDLPDHVTLRTDIVEKLGNIP